MVIIWRKWSLDDPLPKTFNLSDPSKIKATGGGVCVCVCVWGGVRFYLRRLVETQASSGPTPSVFNTFGVLVCVICTSKRFHSFIFKIYTNCSDIEDVHFLFCSHFMNIFSH